jgi:hypothetical protein
MQDNVWPAHALITWTNTGLLGLIPSHCIHWKNCITFSACPSFTYFVSYWFHVKVFNCTVTGVIAVISAATYGRVSLVLKWERFLCPLMFETQVPFICLQPEIQIKLSSHVFSTSQASNGIIRTEKVALTFSISKFWFTYLLPPTTSIPPVQRTCKESLPSLD